jgi:hypothetical protein
MKHPKNCIIGGEPSRGMGHWRENEGRGEPRLNDVAPPRPRQPLARPGPQEEPRPREHDKAKGRFGRLLKLCNPRGFFVQEIDEGHFRASPFKRRNVAEAIMIYGTYAEIVERMKAYPVIEEDQSPADGVSVTGTSGDAVDRAA